MDSTPSNVNKNFHIKIIDLPKSLSESNNLENYPLFFTSYVKEKTIEEESQ